MSVHYSFLETMVMSAFVRTTVRKQRVNQQIRTTSNHQTEIYSNICKALMGEDQVTSLSPLFPTCLQEHCDYLQLVYQRLPGTAKRKVVGHTTYRCQRSQLTKYFLKD